jgi:UDP-N-acetylmuramoyl-L-alanyl-D-glutamate--2,6-diaminopimelate ligase
MNIIHNYSDLTPTLRQKGVINLCSNSKNVEPNSAFFAIRGQKYDGNDFINQALSQGALVAITDFESSISGNKIIKVENTKEALQFCALEFYDTIPANIALITGTNGKTSVAHYVQQLLSILGNKSASIGTLGCNANVELDHIHKSELTTPDFLELRRGLYELSLKNVTYVSIEASSIALTQNRFFGIKAQSSAFTSFASDHLDYHLNKENYLRAKLNLFDQYLKENGAIVLPESLIKIMPTCILEKYKILSIGKNGVLQYKIESSSTSGQTIKVNFENKTHQFSTNIVGNYQAENLLIATLLIHNFGIDFTSIINVLERVSAPSGRLERIKNNIFIDYAHNEDAMKVMLLEIQKFKKANQQVWILFGCGGERDENKRSAMGKIANLFADVVIVTDDNPRNENSQKIRDAIITGCPKAIEIPERKKAIIFAVQNLPPNAILIVAGKGHETYQIIKDKKIPFVEKEIILNALKNL